MRISAFMLFFIIVQTSVQPFVSLEQVSKYALSRPEFPQPTRSDWLNPEYTNFYQSHKPTIWRSIIKFFTLKKTYWSIADLNTLIHKRLERLSKTQQKKTMIARIDIATNPTLYVWGDLRGSFHSLSRALHFLETENVISKDLKIIKSDCFFIFNGNVINGSPYNLETLTLVLALITINPDNVIYLQGEQEYNDCWKNFDIKNQLNLYSDHTKKEDRIAQETLLTDLFSSLPVALYCINTKNKNDSMLRISFFNQSTPWINESFMGSFFDDEQREPIQYYALYQKEKTTYKPFTKAEIRGYDWKNDNRPMNGLKNMDQDKGATTWVLLSSPTASYQTFKNFYYDAFSKIVCNHVLEKSTIALCNRDIREDKNFSYHTPYAMCTAIPVTSPLNNIDKEDVLFGSSMSLIQGVPIMGKRTLHGMMARIHQENKLGGVENHFIRVIVHNDDYNPSIARKNITQFLKKDINTILLPVGSPTLSSYLDIVRQKELIVLFPISGGTAFRDPTLENIINFRASYADEVLALINYAYTEWNARKFALFYQDDSYGQGPRDTAQALLKEKDCTAIDVPYSRAATNIKQQAKIIMESQPDVIAFFSTAQTSIELIRELGIENIANKKLLGISFFAEESFRNFSDRHNIPVLIGAVVPNPFISDLEIVREYRAAMDESGYSYDVFSLEAYIATSILIEVLHKISPPYTKEKIHTQLMAIKGMSLKGITLSYNSTTHTLYDTVYLETGNSNEWVAKKIGEVKP